MKGVKMKKLVSLLLLVLCLPILAADEPAKLFTSDSRVSFYFENDYPIRDRHYTHGTRLSWIDENSTVYIFGQNMYTPWETSATELQKDDRPYAGVLYGCYGQFVGAQTQPVYHELLFGVIGPWALGEETQNWWHKEIWHCNQSQGWDNQINNEVILNYTYKKYHQLESNCDWASFAYYYGGSVGNLLIDALGGGVLTIGYNLNNAAFGPDNIVPTVSTQSKLSVYMFSGMEERLVVFNALLDGNMFSDSHSVEKNWIVIDLKSGCGLRYNRFSCDYTLIYRTYEFSDQIKPDIYNALTLTWQL